MIAADQCSYCKLAWAQNDTVFAILVLKAKENSAVFFVCFFVEPSKDHHRLLLQNNRILVQVHVGASPSNPHRTWKKTTQLLQPFTHLETEFCVHLRPLCYF